MDSLSIDTVSSENFEQTATMSQLPTVTPLGNCEATEVIPSTEQLSPKTSKNVIRRSLRASTLDGVFATVFSNTTGGVLLSNFILNLGASSTQIGLLASIPMLANLLQPIGAYFSEKTTSRHLYCLWIYGISRLLWVVLVIGIFLTSWYHFDAQSLIFWTLGISLATHLLGALGSASWLSWMAVLVPRRLRGRYFGFRNSAANLTNLISIPLLGLIISLWSGGTLEGFAIVLVLGIVFGIVSLAFQFLIVDVNPQMQHLISEDKTQAIQNQKEDQREQNQKENQEERSQFSLKQSFLDILKDTNFLMFLLYFNLWMFSVNLCAPFFNLYLLDNLKLDISQVTLYNSLTAAANLLMLLFWGKVADRIGNRPILIGVGILVAVTPPLWLFTGANELSIWLWLPLLHILGGATWAAIDLCTNNLQIGVAPVQNQSAYFGIVAAVAGVSGALGTLAGGYLAQVDGCGLFGIFALSGVLRLVALLPLVFVHEQRSQPLHQVMQLLFPTAEESSV